MSEEPSQPDQILASVSNLDAARLTLRWALDRIRFLEGAHTESVDLLKQAWQSRDGAAKDLENFRAQFDKRIQALQQKERLVVDMQAMLNGLFKGEFQIKDFLEEKNKLETLKRELESTTRAKIEELEARQRLELAERDRRFAELEAAYQQQLADLRNHHQNELKDLERRHHEEDLNKKEKEALFKDQLLAQVQKQNEQNHQKMILLELEYNAKRKDLQQDYDKLKDKLLEETRHFESKQGFALRAAQARWDEERKALQEAAAAAKAESDKLKVSLTAALDEKERLAVSQSREIATILKLLVPKPGAPLDPKAVESAQNKLDELEEKLQSHVAKELEKQLKLQDEAARRQQELILSLEHSFYEREQKRILENEERLKASEQQYYQELHALREANQRMAGVYRIEIEEARQQYSQLRAEFEARLKDDLSRQIRAHDEQLAKTQEAMKELETRYLIEIQALKDKNHQQAEQHVKELGELQAKLRRQQESFEASLASELEKQLRVRSEQMQKQQESMQAMERSLLELEKKRSADLEARIRASEEERQKEIQALRQEHQNAQAASAQELEEYVQKLEDQHQQKLKALKDENQRLIEANQKETAEAQAKLKKEQEAFEYRLRKEQEAYDMKLQVTMTEATQQEERRILESFARQQKIENTLKAEIQALKEELMKVGDAEIKAQRREAEAAQELQEKVKAAEAKVQKEMQERIRELEESHQRSMQDALKAVANAREDKDRLAIELEKHRQGLKSDQILTDRVKFLEDKLQKDTELLKEENARLAQTAAAERKALEDKLHQAKQDLDAAVMKLQTAAATGGDGRRVQELMDQNAALMKRHDAEIKQLKAEKEKLGTELASLKQAAAAGSGGGGDSNAELMALRTIKDNLEVRLGEVIAEKDRLANEQSTQIQLIMAAHAEAMEKIRAHHIKELEASGSQVQKQRMTISDLMRQVEELSRKVPKP